MVKSPLANAGDIREEGCVPDIVLPPGQNTSARKYFKIKVCTFFLVLLHMYRGLWGRSLEEGVAAHSSILAWRIPWTEEAGGVQSIGLQRVGHN